MESDGQCRTHGSLYAGSLLRRFPLPFVIPLESPGLSAPDKVRTEPSLTPLVVQCPTYEADIAMKSNTS